MGCPSQSHLPKFTPEHLITVTSILCQHSLPCIHVCYAHDSCLFPKYFAPHFARSWHSIKTRAWNPREQHTCFCFSKFILFLNTESFLGLVRWRPKGNRKDRDFTEFKKPRVKLERDLVQCLAQRRCTCSSWAHVSVMKLQGGGRTSWKNGCGFGVLGESLQRWMREFGAGSICGNEQ